MTASNFDRARFGIGQPVPRKEDPTLLRGNGSYTDDLKAEDQVYLAFVRSPVAHGNLRAVDIEDALSMEGVLAAWTGADMKAAGLKMAPSLLVLNNRDGSPMHQTERYVLAVDKVRLAGEPIACIAATSAFFAQNAAEAVSFEIEDLPAVTDAEEALEPGAPQLFDHIPDNVLLDFFEGDESGTDAAFAKAAFVAELGLEDPRVVINPMELRSCLAIYDGEEDRYTLHTQSQGVFPLHREIAGILGIEQEKVRVLTGNVGGSFGMRIVAFPEQICALVASKALGKPVKWLEDRTTSFLTDFHGRGNRYRASLAVDADGHILAVRVRGFGNLGAYVNPYGLGAPTRNVIANVSGVYRVPVLDVGIKCVLTNTSPIGAYRGAGRQAANYIIERLMDEAARISGIDRVTLRRINQLRQADLPYRTPGGLTVDVGDFTALMDDTLKAADVDGFAARRDESRRNGKLRGLGIGCFLEATSLLSKELGRIRFEENGDVTFITGTLDYGQGHASTFAQIVGEKLGVPFERIRLLQGDSDEVQPWGGYTAGSRSTVVSGNAAMKAGDMVIEKALKAANWALNTTANDIEFHDGRLVIGSTGEGISLIDLAQRLRNAENLPAGLPETLDSGLVAEEGATETFPNGCHVCEVEIDEDTGVTRVVRYMMTNDTGVVINPLLLEGQCHGGVAQGIGQALLERVVYDENGQMLSGSLTDYCLPRADDLPMFTTRSRPTKTGLNALGVKGVGESGCAGSLTSVMNAVADALSTVGVTHIDMPATPEAVWRAMRSKAVASA